ncbi:hypothetical protein PG985_005496 [Apiospora marii]|uniref:uncharacterized protein n=1 Tax=Apiospora marii TaxID=335849 RepID=UPI00312F5249
MVERDDDAPRRKVAVACGRCRKRKIRCSGDPGNGGPCSNYYFYFPLMPNDPPYEYFSHLLILLDLRTQKVSSTETHLREGSDDYGYDVQTAPAYYAYSSGGAKGSNSTAWTGAGAYPDGGGVAAVAKYDLGDHPPYANKASTAATMDCCGYGDFGESPGSYSTAASAALSPPYNMAIYHGQGCAGNKRGDQVD